MFCVALASLVLATSCSQDDLQTAKFSQNTINPNVELGGQPISTFAAAKGKAVKSRAVETTITNLGSFTMNAFQDGETNYMKDVKYTSTDGSVWNTDAGTFYWPVEGNLHFYAYAPEQPGQAGTFKLDKDAQTDRQGFLETGGENQGQQLGLVAHFGEGDQSGRDEEGFHGTSGGPAA